MKKTCSRCKVEKDVSEFSVTKHKKNDGITYWCLVCFRDTKRKRHHTDPLLKAKLREKRMKKLYNMSLEDFDRLLESQGNACAICRAACPKGTGNNAGWAVDHEHNTDPVVVRGILCPTCNCMLGYFKR